MSELHLLDEATAADLATYIGRAKRHDADGAMRLQAVPTSSGGVLAAWTCVLPGRGLVHDGLVLGLRTLPLASVEQPVDVVVSLSALTDRTSRGIDPVLPVPPTVVTATWAAVAPPRSGWAPMGTVPAGVLLDAAAAGIGEVATGTPDGAGAAAVTDLRHRVWGRPLEGVEASVAAGAAFGMSVLGFVGTAVRDEPVAVHQTGPWTRLSSEHGYVLCR